MDTYTPSNYQHPAKIDLRRLPAFISRIPKPYEPDAFTLLKESLARCLNLDDAQWHLDWAGMAAAWARMAGPEGKKVEADAKRLRVHCWVQCGRVLLDNKEPRRLDAKTGQPTNRTRGCVENPNGRVAKARAAGMSKSDVQVAIALAKTEKEKLNFFLEGAKNIPTPACLSRLTIPCRARSEDGTGRPRKSEMRNRLRIAGWSNFLLLTRNFTAKDVADGIAPGPERHAVKEEVEALLTWLEDLHSRVSVGRTINV